MYAVEVENVRKFFKKFEALKGISLKVREGEVFGIIGPNGSGKSTLLRILVGVLEPDSGKVSVLGMNPYRERIKLAKRTGVLFSGMSSLVPYAPFIDSLRFIASLYGLRGEAFEERAEKVAEEMQINNLLKKKPVEMSLGQRMRCELASALIHDPELLVLDEPTNGLDIIAKDLLLKKVRELAGDKTVLIVSHDLEEIERVCNNITIINRGKNIFTGTIDSLRKRVNYRKCRITLERPFGKKRVIEINVKNLSIHDVLAVFERYGVRDVEISAPPIEEVIAEFYR